jgi:hypothetical protein
MRSTHFAMVAFGTLALVLGSAGGATHIQHGKVVTADGKALNGVLVRGVSIKNTALQKSVQTDNRGDFSWSITTSVFHFYKNGYEPVIVVRPDASVPRQVVMIPEKREKIILPTCGRGDAVVFYPDGLWFKRPEGTQVYDVGGGFHGPTREIRFENNGAQLELIPSETHNQIEPSDAWVLQSSSMSIENLHNAKGDVVGYDARGVKGGLTWRLFDNGGMIFYRYENALPHEAEAFDGIIAREGCWEDFQKDTEEWEKLEKERDERSRVP